MMIRMLRSAAIAGLIVSGLGVAGSAQAAKAPPYKVDTAHTQIIFAVDHMGFSTTHGTFKTFTVDLKFDPAKAAKTTVNVNVDTSSIATGFGPRDEHLKSPDFFNAAQFPSMTFKSTKTEVTGDNTAKLTGNLTLLGVTKPITLDVKLVDNGPSPFAPTANVYGFSATGMIKRSDFGMTKFVPAPGGRGVGDDISFTIGSEINNLPPPPAAPTPAAPKAN